MFKTCIASVEWEGFIYQTNQVDCENALSI